MKVEEIIKDIKQKIWNYESLLGCFNSNSVQDIINRVEIKKEIEALKVVLNIYKRALESKEV